MTALAMAPTLFDERSGEPTLDDVITGAWAALAAGQVGACPVCEGDLVAAYAAHARPVAGRCKSCGSVLS